MADVTSSIRTHLHTVELAVRRRPLFEVVSADVVERDLKRPLPQLKPIPGLEFRSVSPTQSQGWRDFLPRKRWRIAEVCLSRGHQAYFAMVEGDLAARIIISRAAWQDPRFGLHIRLAPDEAYAYGAEAYLPYRHLGVAAAVVAEMLSDLRADRAVERVYGWVDPRNREQQALLRIVFGFTQVQTVKRALLLRRIGWQVPGSDQPSFGPLSRVGRHSEAQRP